MANWFQYQTE